ncbi:uncharacterized protein LOC143957062 isoform X1 [Lithobates pipiens]
MHGLERGCDCCRASTSSGGSTRKMSEAEGRDQTAPAEARSSYAKGRPPLKSFSCLHSQHQLSYPGPKMFTLKKSLLLLFFLGIVSLSLCEQARDADEEENGGEVTEKEVKRDYTIRTRLHQESSRKVL